MISIIIVHYRTKDDILECLNSLYRFSPKIPFEVIIVDNSEKKVLKKIIKKYKNIKYIPSDINIGYGAGINLGASYAKGEYLFVVNQDVVFKQEIFTNLIKDFKKSEKIGIVAPLLLKTDGSIMDQGARELTPLRAIIKFSFLDKIFPRNPISKSYWFRDWKINKLHAVDNVPGTAFMIRKEIFDDIGGFDKNFFLYFEEFDLCKTVREKGYKIYIDSSLKLIHKWGTSTKELSNINEIFKKSRRYYFKKHYGLIKSSLIEIFLSINKSTIFLLLIFLLGLFLRLYKVDTLSPFIGDQGWFFMSAKDFLVSHQIPLVGIASSHPWLHQGPLWTYIVSVLFLFTNFNPVSPFYFSSIIDTFTILLVYKICKDIFSFKTAIFASVIYTLSPYAVLSSRMAYHTALIPFFMALFFYSIIKWINGDRKHFPLVILYLSILYNFELQTSVLIILFLLIFIFGFLKKKTWFVNTLNFKIITLSIFAFLIPMLPILVYDFNNGFPQTIVFAGWLVYKGTSFLSNIVFDRELTKLGEYSKFLSYFYNFFNKLIFAINGITSSALIIISFVFLLIKNLNDYFQKKINVGYLMILFLLVFLLLGILISKTQSEAYLMSLFVPVIILLSIFLNFISRRKPFFIITFLIVLYLSVINIFYLVTGDYNYGPDLKNRMEAAKYMVSNSKNKDFSIFGIGLGSQFESFTSNYKFLTWYFGNEAKYRGEITYILYESPFGIKIIRKD